jgi:hypothetical protein
LYIIDPDTPEITAPVQQVSINAEQEEGEEKDEEEEMVVASGTAEIPASPDEMRVNGRTLWVSPFGVLCFLAPWCVGSGMPQDQIASIWAPTMSEEEFTDLLDQDANPVDQGANPVDQGANPVESSCVNTRAPESRRPVLYSTSSLS